jgi:hypothetical protein
MIESSELETAYKKLKIWCRSQDYSGYDPFDGLNSRLFQLTPLKHFRLARLAWIQFFKRSPLNFRPLSFVPKGKNPKGLALFALAALAEHRRTKANEDEARNLLDTLLNLKLNNFNGACWGYNFDWQGRAFFAPHGTPTIVPTAFAARAFVEAAKTFDDKQYAHIASDVCAFILRDLNRSEENENEICFSYSPIDNTRVFNASLLAAETLATVGAMTNEKSFTDLAIKGARYVVRRQNANGSWAYGADDYQSWADNFHTAFVLSSLKRIVDAVPDFRDEFTESIRRGYKFWIENFFLADGTPKYFHDKTYPIDSHSSGAAIATLVDLKDEEENALSLAEKIARWTIEEMQTEQGYFYYQLKPLYPIDIPYMRWSQAWMLYALSRLSEVKSKK